MTHSAAWPTSSPRADFLAGCHVVELSTRASGAYAGRLLALMGAEVVRVDLPSAFDCRPDELEAVRASLHEHKTPVDPADQPAVADALRRAELIVVDSMDDDAFNRTARDLVRDLLAQAPSGVHVVECPAHRDGPGTSLTACAGGGMTWALGDVDDVPLTLPFDLPEYLTGTETAASAAVALLTTPRQAGQHWSVSAADVVSCYVGQICSNFIPYERPWRRDGARASMSGGSYPAAMFRCKDGWMSVMCRTQPEWHGLATALGHSEWLDDVRLQDSRVVARHHADELDPVVTDWCAQHTRQEVFEAGRLHGFPVAPVLTVNEALNEEQFAHRRFFVDAEDGRLAPGSPFRITEPPRDAAPVRPMSRLHGTRPLSGLRVLDLAWVWSGPMVTATLADLGAEVIKVESSRRPDPSRLRGRAIRDGEPVRGPELEVTPYHNQMNRGKQSIEIDIASARGAEIVRQLAAQCDVVVENMRPGVLSRRGLDYATLAENHPELVMVSLSMLGQTGPLSDIRGYAVVMSGLAGLDSLIGYDDQRLIGTFNPALGDPNGAAHGLVALLAALRRAQRHGRGAWIDVSQVEAILSVLHTPLARAQRDGMVAPPANAHSKWWPHGVYRCAGTDSWVAIAARNDNERAAVSDWYGVRERLAEFVATLPVSQVVTDLTQRGVPVAEIASFETLREGNRDVFDLVDHPWLGSQPLFGVPWRVAGERLPVVSPSPTLGADTDVVLKEVLGLSAEDVRGLRQEGVVGAG